MTLTTDAGHLVGQLVTPAGRERPYPLYQQLHAHGQAAEIPGGLVLVCGHAEAVAALRDPRLAVEDAAWLDRIFPAWREHPSRVLLNNSMVFVNGRDHEQMRCLVSRTFTARRVDELRPAIARRVNSLLDRLADLGGGGAAVEYMAEFAFLMPLNVICDLLGVPEADRVGFREPIASLAAVIEPGSLNTDLSAADRAAEELAGYFAGLIADRRSHPRTDLLTAMTSVNDRADRPLSEECLVANAIFLLLAGFESTIGLLGNGLMLLLERPAALARLRACPQEAPAFVEEMLRCEAPVQLTGRRASAGTEVGGIDVPAGGSVIVLMGAANRDPRRFADPDRFDPDRPDNQPLSFGGGVHYCLGARLARLEAQVAFPLLLRRFPRVALAGTPIHLDRLNLRAYATLLLTLT
ncbi:MAG TPA: cytochrome P450 [Streptosporangiaceae bacterium]|jgi:cytochrome P450|nr:cytochrome P450 [Streptosporangiaceae bacterium]